MAELAEQNSMTLQTRIREAVERYKNLPSNKKILLFAGLAAIVAIIIALVLWNKQPAYKVLFSNISDKDGGQITAALQQMNVPYQLGPGGVISVPTENVYETRLKLASQGLPKASGAGFELMDNQKFGISQFAEQINYQRAIEGELARTIESLNVVESARVHLAIPKNSVFLREQQKPTASIMVSLFPGRVLDAGQISGVINLVSSSVPGLPAKNITIVDQEGNLLSNLSDINNDNSGLNKRQLAYVRQIEQDFVKRIQTILEPIFGKENVRAEVTAAVDFSEVEQTAEIYTPNSPPNQSAIRSQQTAESVKRDTDQVGGVPGALANQPPNAAAAPIQLPPGTQAGLLPGGQQAGNASPVASNRETTTNFEVDRTIQHTKSPVGTVKRLSAAVVVNYKRQVDAEGNAKFVPLSANELQQINNLVREAMGYSQDRGDSLNVVNTAFVENLDTQTLQDRVITYATENAESLIKYVLTGLLLLYLLFWIVRPIVRDILNPPPSLPGMEGSDETGAAPKDEITGEPLDEREIQRRLYEANLEAARQIVRNDPRMAAQIIKEWVSGDE